MTGTLLDPPAAPAPPRPSGGPAPWRWSRTDYYRLADLGFFRGKRVELIDGGVIEMSPMGTPHCTSVSLALHAVGDAFSPGHHVRVQMALTLAGS